MPRKQRHRRSKTSSRRSSPSEMWDTILVLVRPGGSVQYQILDMPTGPAWRSFRIVRAIAHLACASPGTATCELRICNPAYGTNDDLAYVGSSGPIVLGSAPRMVTARAMNGQNVVPMGRSSTTRLATISNICYGKTATSVEVMGTLRVLIRYSTESINVACPTLLVSEPDVTLGVARSQSRLMEPAHVKDSNADPTTYLQFHELSRMGGGVVDGGVAEGTTYEAAAILAHRPSGTSITRSQKTRSGSRAREGEQSSCHVNDTGSRPLPRLQLLLAAGLVLTCLVLMILSTFAISRLG